MKKSDQLFTEIIAKASFPISLNADDLMRLRRDSAKMQVFSKFEECFDKESAEDKLECSITTSILGLCKSEGESFYNCLATSKAIRACYIPVIQLHNCVSYHTGLLMEGHN